MKTKLIIEKKRICKIFSMYRLVFVNQSNLYRYEKDYSVAFMLGMYTSEYKNMLKKNGGKYFDKHGYTMFFSEKKAKQALDKIESILLINNLLE